jgi:nicotinate-nucleotide adenylyltransferase
VALFGSAFDPPHLAHAALARAALDQLNLHQLRVVPTGHAWHKDRVLSSAQHRHAMAQMLVDDLATTHGQRVCLDDCELRRSGPSYTADTLAQVQRLVPQSELFVVLGLDQATKLHRWHRLADVLAQARMAVALRPDEAEHGHTERGRALQGPPVPVPPDRLVWLHMPPSQLSSTAVRQAVAHGIPIDAMVSPPVARYIGQNHLYAAQAAR